MARVQRTRSRSSTLVGTKETTRGGVVVNTQTSTLSRTSTCVDFHGRPVIDSAFSSTQYVIGLRVNGSIVDGVAGSAASGYTFTEYPWGPVLNSVNTGQLVPPNDWYTTTIARTNPSRPVVTPLTLIQDFVDIPRQLRDIGRLLRRPSRTLTAKELANQNLAFQFGWLPLVEDVNHLLNLQVHVLRRAKELKRLYSGVGLRRRVNILDDHQAGVYVERVSPGLATFVDLKHDITVVRRVWASIHWIPTTLPPVIEQDYSMNLLARQVVLGWTQEGLIQGAWDLLPWTWLTDWFVNVGAFLGTHSNTVPASHSAACLMGEVVVTCNPVVGLVQPASRSTVAVSGVYKYSSRTRGVSGTVVPGFNIPFVGLSQLSILGSLFVQRFLR